jgi:hypothetical protein
MKAEVGLMGKIPHSATMIDSRRHFDDPSDLR